MTLDEAITLCSEVIGEKYLDGHVKCASNHEQFKEWLEELKHITNPQPYKFEDLKKGMWVWDEEIGACMFVKEVNRKINIVTLVGGESFLLETVHITVKFEENRFYPVTKTLEAK